jgi:hypothetical protein
MFSRFLINLPSLPLLSGTPTSADRASPWRSPVLRDLSFFQFSFQHKEQCTLLYSILDPRSSLPAGPLGQSPCDQVPVLTISGIYLGSAETLRLFAARRFNAKLEMVRLVLHLYELLTTDLHPGQDCL